MASPAVEATATSGSRRPFLLLLVLALALALGLLLLVASPVQAGQSTPQWFISQFNQQQPVEQQTPGGAGQLDQSLWVVNPTSCLWDADDRVEAAWYGRLNRGQSESLTICVVGDWAAHLFSIGASEGVTTQITASEGPTASLCIVGPDYDHDFANPNLSSIAGSNGGVGHVHWITFTIRNDGRHPLNRALALVTISTDYPQEIAWRCPGIVDLPGREPRWAAI